MSFWQLISHLALAAINLHGSFSVYYYYCSCQCVQVCRDAGSVELHRTGLAVVPEGAPVHSWMGRPLPTGGEWEQVRSMSGTACS